MTGQQEDPYRRSAGMVPVEVALRAAAGRLERVLQGGAVVRRADAEEVSGVAGWLRDLAGDLAVGEVVEGQAVEDGADEPVPAGVDLVGAELCDEAGCASRWQMRTRAGVELCDWHAVGALAGITVPRPRG